MKKLFFLLLFLLNISYISVAGTEGYTVVLRSRSDVAGAGKSISELSKFGYDLFYLKMMTKYGTKYRICAGKYPNMKEASAARTSIAQETSIKDAWIMNLKDYFDIDEFNTRIRELAMSINLRDIRAVQGFVNPDYGIIVEKDSNTLRFADFSTMIDSIALACKIDKDSLLNLISGMLSESYVVTKLPKYDCDSNKYDKDGTYMLNYSLKLRKLMNDDTNHGKKSKTSSFNTVKLVSTQTKILPAIHFSLIGSRWIISKIQFGMRCDTK